MNDHVCTRYSPQRRRYSTLSYAMVAADRYGDDIEVRRCDENLGGCGGWHLPEGVDWLRKCPTPEKISFDREWEAEEYLGKMQRYLQEKIPGVENQHVYLCRFQPHDVSGGLIFHYHLTSQPEESTSCEVPTQALPDGDDSRG